MTVRLYCSHNLGGITGDLSEMFHHLDAASVIPTFATYMEESGGHIRGALFDENGESPFAVLGTDKGSIVAWKFVKEAAAEPGRLFFEEMMTVDAWIHETLTVVMNKLETLGIQTYFQD